ncbi:tyrosyl-tRNA synthetase [Vibrio ichthyoenteri ATCC 700023]|uniref:Tyrosine--tRNA ligase n=1 Tax=Vibrio ichthyoenteri ATCC 700023 TaxID=870968 RepID=F9S0K0_9VIBR|nr:tyrosine--tRNA ligase [Vibrio ichthyoenteri]EGU43178.1 tyrosyl-tRNA synthetase [Vibrio ichthyoenteri ATCC 700023]
MPQQLIENITQRGLVSQISQPDDLIELLTTPQTVYCGFDPTAGSLHIGHLVPLIMLKRFQDAGHSAVALIGGATGLIGDPSFKASERTLNGKDTVQEWVDALSHQISTIMQPHLDKPLTLQNNADWLGPMQILDFFRDVGKHFSVNAMINRESVKQRLLRPEQGLSFTEFSYSLLQSYDFVELNRRFGCRIQIGGNDQWGNIVSGIDLTRRLNGETVYGLTLPLITKSDGTKFGKTEGGAVWLDPRKTSPYSFYQFWLSVDDCDVYRFLRFYTFLTNQEIDAIEEQDKARQGKPIAQKVLAEQLTQFVHGSEGLSAAQRITQALFSGDVQQLSLVELKQLALDGLEVTTIEESEISIAHLLVESGLASSNRIAREHIENQAIRINGERVSGLNESLGFPLFDQFWIVQRGKKQFRLITKS